MNITEILPGAVSFFDAYGLPLAIGAWLAFWCIGRLYKNFKAHGQERMGLYLAMVLQAWTVLILFTAPFWLPDALIKARPLAWHFEELRLVATPEPEHMVYWSAGLLLAMTAAAWILGAVQEALRIPPTPVRILMQPVTTAETATWSLLVSPSAGFCEEILFRSILVPLAASLTGDLWLGVATASLVFGALHFTQGLLGVLAITAMGAILAAGMIFSGSIWPSIVAHALYNMAVPFLYRLDGASTAPA